MNEEKKVFVKIQKIYIFFFFFFFFLGGGVGGIGSGGVGLGGQGGCERRIEVFGKIHKKNRGGVGLVGGQGGCERNVVGRR